MKLNEAQALGRIAERWLQAQLPDFEQMRNARPLHS